MNLLLSSYNVLSSITQIFTSCLLPSGHPFFFLFILTFSYTLHETEHEANTLFLETLENVHGRKEKVNEKSMKALNIDDV